MAGVAGGRRNTPDERACSGCSQQIMWLSILITVVGQGEPRTPTRWFGPEARQGSLTSAESSASASAPSFAPRKVRKRRSEHDPPATRRRPPSQCRATTTPTPSPLCNPSYSLPSINQRTTIGGDCMIYPRRRRRSPHTETFSIGVARPPDHRRSRARRLQIPRKD